MTPLQITALTLKVFLLVFATKWPRLRVYMAWSLTLNLLLSLLKQIPAQKPYVGVDLALILLEGLLFVISPTGLAWALRASWRAVGLFLWSSWVYVVLSWPSLSGARLMTYYVVTSLVAHVYIVGHTLWRTSGRTEKCPEERALLILAVVGLSGVGIAILGGGDDWGLVSVGNVATYAILGGLHFRTKAEQSRSDL